MRGVKRQPPSLKKKKKRGNCPEQTINTTRTEMSLKYCFMQI